MSARCDTTARRRRQPWTERARARHRARRRGDGGFTLVEVLVALVILGLVVPAVMFITRNLNQQAANIGSTVQGVQQDQTAGEALYPYLQSATAVLADSTSTYLDAEIYFGFDQANAIPNTARLQVRFEPAPVGQQTTLETSLTPTLGATRTVGTYFALYEPNAFTYEYNTPNGPSGVSDPSALATPSSTLAGTVQVSQIIAVAVNITFLAGPNSQQVASNEIQPSHYNTTVYLENALGANSKQTDLTLISPGTIMYSPDGSVTSYLQAVISPPPSVGTVSFSISLSSMTGPVVICSAAPVLAGVATCAFSSPGYGGGTATAQYSPPAFNTEYLPSPIIEASVESFVPTTINYGTVTDALGQRLVVPATVSDSVTGGPAVPAQGQVVFTYYLCPNQTAPSTSSTTSSTTPTGACSSTIAGGPDTVCLPCSSGSSQPTWTDTTFYDSGNFPNVAIAVPGSWIEVNASYQGDSYFAPSSRFSVPFQMRSQ